MNKTVPAAIAFLSLLAVAAPATATQRPEPEKGPVPQYTVVKDDPKGDHYRIDNGPSEAVKASIDLTRVTYRVVRDTDTPSLTITYRVRDVTPAGNVDQGFFTIVNAADGEEVMISSYVEEGIVVTSGNGNVCDDATVTIDATDNTVTQSVPLDCLAVSRGRIRSATLLEKNDGARDVALDYGQRTGRLPLSPVEETGPVIS